MTYSVHDEDGFERTYDEDDTVTIRKGDLRAVLDVATMSMDFGSGFLDNEQVEALRKLAELIGIDPLLATPHNFVCQYKGAHQWQSSDYRRVGQQAVPAWYCPICQHYTEDDPTRQPV